jgi:hypothetical protein
MRKPLFAALFKFLTNASLRITAVDFRAPGKRPG